MQGNVHNIAIIRLRGLYLCLARNLFPLKRSLGLCQYGFFEKIKDYKGVQQIGKGHEDAHLFASLLVG
jgi:hypothetical protein